MLNPFTALRTPDVTDRAFVIYLHDVMGVRGDTEEAGGEKVKEI